MLIYKDNKTDKATYYKETCFLTLFVSITLFLISPDSYTHDLFNRVDSAWFFTCGKAWMNGMIPYVDFTDSKGPLLWLIFGIGYLISNTTYIGMFWISCLTYTITYIINYKTAKLFLEDSKSATLAILLLTLSYFNSWMHYEFRAEDCCLPFISIILYRLCYVIYNQATGKHNLYITNFLLGLCLMAIILIKFSLALMLGPAYLYYLYYLIREKKNLIIALLLFMAGCAVTALPFLIYFLLQGNLTDFIQEYFINTLLTVQGANSTSTFIDDWLSIFCEQWAARTILLTVCIVGCCWISRQVPNDKIFPFIIFVGFYTISLHHAYANHYLGGCLIFSIWLCMAISKSMEQELAKHFRKTVSLVSVSILLFLFFLNYTTEQGLLIRNAFFYDNQDRTDYYNVSWYMSQIHKPKIIYLETKEYGYGTPADALPGCKYWSTQLGATPAMLSEQLNSLNNADFIITVRENPNYSHNIAALQEANFRKCYSYNMTDATFEVYTKHSLKSPPANFHVSNSDVLFKRKVLQLK